jgi:hypothetical protein
MAWHGPFTLSPRVLPSTSLARECRVLLVTHRRCSVPRLASTLAMLWHPPRKAVEGYRCRTTLYINQVIPSCRSIFSIFHHHQIITSAFPTLRFALSTWITLASDIQTTLAWSCHIRIISFRPVRFSNHLIPEPIEINDHASHSSLHCGGWRRLCTAWWIWRARGIPAPSSVRIWHWFYFRHLELDYSCALPVKLILEQQLLLG